MGRALKEFKVNKDKGEVTYLTKSGKIKTVSVDQKLMTSITNASSNKEAYNLFKEDWNSRNKKTEEFDLSSDSDKKGKFNYDVSSNSDGSYDLSYTSKSGKEYTITLSAHEFQLYSGLSSDKDRATFINAYLASRNGYSLEDKDNKYYKASSNKELFEEIFNEHEKSKWIIGGIDFSNFQNTGSIIEDFTINVKGQGDKTFPLSVSRQASIEKWIKEGNAKKLNQLLNNLYNYGGDFIQVTSYQNGDSTKAVTSYVTTAASETAELRLVTGNATSTGGMEVTVGHYDNVTVTGCVLNGVNYMVTDDHAVQVRTGGYLQYTENGKSYKFSIISAGTSQNYKWVHNQKITKQDWDENHQIQKGYLVDEKGNKVAVDGIYGKTFTPIISEYGNGIITNDKVSYVPGTIIDLSGAFSYTTADGTSKIRMNESVPLVGGNGEDFAKRDDDFQTW